MTTLIFDDFEDKFYDIGAKIVQLTSLSALVDL